MNKYKRNKNALTVGIAVSIAVLVCLMVVSQSVGNNSVSVSDAENSNIKNGLNEDNISVNDIIGLSPRNEDKDNAVLEAEDADNQVATVNTEITEKDNEVVSESSDAEEIDEPVSENSITVSVDGYDLADATWPVKSRDIVMGYSYNTTPIYSKTYNEYRSDHAGIDIAAQIGEEVKCAYNGKVIEITSDGRLGKLIKVEHAEGIYSIYANLDDNVKVTLNQRVEEGEVIGAVGNTAASESAEESHLHFGVIAFGDYVNPLEYIKAE